MLEQIKNIKTWFGKIIRTENSYERGDIKPTRDWGVILTTSLFILIVLGCLSGFFYFQVNNGTFFTINNDSVEGVIKINRSLLDSTIKDISNRKDVFERISNGGNIPPDPSL